LVTKIQLTDKQLKVSTLHVSTSYPVTAFSLSSQFSDGQQDPWC
jgi:hypothetical protein